jgi:hypothetical protein
MKALARLLCCTEGHAYTALIALVIAVVMGVTGLPPLLRYDDATPEVQIPVTTTIAIPRFGETPTTPPPG